MEIEFTDLPANDRMYWTSSGVTQMESVGAEELFLTPQPVKRMLFE